MLGAVGEGLQLASYHRIKRTICSVPGTTQAWLGRSSRHTAAANMLPVVLSSQPGVNTGMPLRSAASSQESLAIWKCFFTSGSASTASRCSDGMADWPLAAVAFQRSISWRSMWRITVSGMQVSVTRFMPRA